MIHQPQQQQPLFKSNSVQFSHSEVWLFVTPWITARQASLSITNSWSSPRLMSIESMMPSSHPYMTTGNTIALTRRTFVGKVMWKAKVKSLSRVRLFTTPWTAAYQAPPPMWFSRQEYWSGLPLPSPRRLLETQKYKVSSSHLPVKGVRVTNT